jgi:hypothetical protein
MSLLRPPRPDLKPPKSPLRALTQEQADAMRDLYHHGEDGVRVSIAQLRNRFRKADGTMVSRQAIWLILQGKTYVPETPETDGSEGSANG